ncbi:MAG: ABC transporter substrate-binding protein [Halanaerobiales bacterium]
MEKARSRSIYIFVIAIIVALVVFFVYQNQQTEDLQIGVIQIVEHPALDAARQGFIDVLEENGYVEGENVTYDIQVAQGDMSTANTIAQKFNSENLDMVLAIATPTAQAVANVIEDTPILITAVTDPVDAGLVESVEQPNTNVTGTNDMQPMDKQFELILDFVPDAEKVGVVYNAGEANSVLQVDIAREIADDLGITLVEASADTTANVKQAAESLIGRVDAIYVPTDNTVVSAIDAVIMIAEDNDIPLIVGEEGGVRAGALATVGIDYYELGRQTARMALEILDGDAQPATMAVQSQEDTRLIINESAAEAMAVEIPAEVRENATEIIE